MEGNRRAAAVIDGVKRGNDLSQPEPLPMSADTNLTELCLKNLITARCKPKKAEKYRTSIECAILLTLVLGNIDFDRRAR